MDESGFPGEFEKFRIVIIGLGLLGGSIALNLRKHNCNITGIDNQVKTLEYATSQNIINNGTRSLEQGIIGADIIILAVPVRAIFSILDQLNQIGELPTNANCMIMDVGSTKVQIVEKMSRLSSTLQPIGGHPMCGRETSGIESAVASLFIDAFFMLTPLPRTSEQTIAQAKYIVKLLGARPYIVEAERHDRLAAAASHLPFSVASVLMTAAMETGSDDDLLWEAVSSGFRDTSRLAACDVTVMVDILLSNGKAICQEIDTFDNYLHDFRNAVERQDEHWLKDFLYRAKQKRITLFNK